MKLVLVIPDGCADEPQPILKGKTPLEAAHIPHMDAVAAIGMVGEADHVPLPMPSGSDVGTMSLFGYDPLLFHTGRAPLEAAAQGITLGPEDWAVRCNLVTTHDGLMKSFTAGQIPSDVAASLLKEMQAALPADSPWEFFPGVSYRNLLIFRGAGRTAPFDKATSTTPPHDVTDQPFAPHLPQGQGADELLKLMEWSRDFCAKHPANQARGDNAATQIWLWGQGQRPALEAFSSKYGPQGAVITAVDLLRGIGRLIGWKVIEVPGATGYLDTDYAAKGRYAIDALKNGVELMVVHVEATDEASHEGHAFEKVKALEEIDRHIVGPVHEYLKSQGEYRLLVCPDHPTFLRTKTHSHGYSPFALCGTNVPQDNATHYSEPEATRAGTRLTRGCDLMNLLVNGVKG
ncbi:proposed homoserine kinase [Planctopirus limnophila DSM 3776]|uniref:Proposed homoserine kinase n=1 Tax=Planctopirus limnophila (strain ATCC 43296 / DSM 3776 / IFAM 1008 / Mu 290) TaxID=521674 RepID=D5SP04_PLAL2|nr:cofactor-independent phosphoglycerate mutase [Planctopirus limnophila]ADG66159.1 proposed homoserine kinase [Planctopirus limnophila DSM 3776]